MTVATFDRKTAMAVQADMLKALQDVAERHGLVITNDGGSVGVTESTFKFKARVKDLKNALNSAQAEFDLNAALLGYKKEWFGKTFKHGNTSYTITGVAPNRRANPIRAKNARGKEYLFKTRDVAEYFGDTIVLIGVPTADQEAAAERRAMRRMFRHER